MFNIRTALLEENNTKLRKQLEAERAKRLEVERCVGRTKQVTKANKGRRRGLSLRETTWRQRTRPAALGTGAGPSAERRPSRFARRCAKGPFVTNQPQVLHISAGTCSDRTCLTCAKGPYGHRAEAPACPGGGSHWRDCHSAAPPSTFSRCFNSDGERASAK